MLIKPLPSLLGLLKPLLPFAPFQMLTLVIILPVALTTTGLLQVPLPCSGLRMHVPGSLQAVSLLKARGLALSSQVPTGRWGTWQEPGAGTESYDFQVYVLLTCGLRDLGHVARPL